MLKSIRNSLVLTSVLYTALGVVLILFPGSALQWASIVIGGVTLCYGAVRLYSYWKAGGGYQSRFDLFLGMILALLGVFLMVSPQFLASVIPVTLGVYILVDGVSSIKKALDMKALGFEKWWISLTAALVLSLLGLVMVLRPFSLMSHLVVFIGVSFVFDGVFTLANTVAADRIYKAK